MKNKGETIKYMENKTQDVIENNVASAPQTQEGEVVSAPQTQEDAKEEKSVSEEASAEMQVETSVEVAKVKRPIQAVSAKTNVDAKAVIALSQRVFLSRWYMMAIPSVLLVALGGLIWGIMASQYIEDGAAVGIALIVAGVVIPGGLFVLWYFVLIGNNSAAAVAGRTKVIEFTFGLENIAVKQTVTPEDGNETVAESTFEWSDVLRVLEVKAYFFLILANNHSIIVDKMALRDLCLEDFKNLLVDKLGDKYKLKQL